MIKDRRTTAHTKRSICRIVLSFILLYVISGALTACGKGSDLALDKKNPKEITVWYTFSDKRAAAFEKMINEFNEGEGLERGIIVKGTAFDTEKALLKEYEETKELPNMLGINSTCSLLYDKKITYVDINSLVASNTKSDICKEYIKAGTINKEWRLFPVVKDTPVMAINLVMWQPFMNSEEMYLNELETWENCSSTGTSYYEFTGGQSLLAIDSEADYMLAGCHQLDADILNIEGSNTVIRTEGNAMKKLWENYYVSFVKGAYYKYNSSCLDDIKESTVAGAVLKSSLVSELSDRIATEGDADPAGAYSVLPCPQFNGYDKICLADDSGVAIVDKDETEDFASMLFLEWLTGDEVNLKFACLSGAMPVNKNDKNIDKLEKAMEKLDMTDIEKETMRVVVQTMNDGSLYAPPLSEYYSDLRKTLEGAMSREALNDRNSVESSVYIGEDQEKAVSKFTSDDHFSSFLMDLKNRLPKP